MKQNSIAIVGCGIMGLSAAYALKQYAGDIVMYDPAGFPAQNASMMAGGMLAPYSEIEHMSQNWLDAGLESIAAWEAFAKTHEIGFHKTGSLLIAHEQDQYILERFKTHLPDDGASRFLNAADLFETEPNLDGRFKHGILLNREAYLNPSLTMHALANDAKERGVQMIPKAVTPEDIENEYDFVLDCRGMNAAQNEPDLRGVKGEILSVYNPEFTLQRPVRLMHPRYPLYIVPHDGHIFTIGATMIESEEDAHLSVRSNLELLSALYSLHPSFGDAKVVSAQAGIRPSYPDNLPRVRRNGNIISCNGLYRHGYLFAPLMAGYAADLINDKTSNYASLFDKKEAKDGHTDTERAA